jgi:acyl-CoA synthetase (AMP-forming)/AMP-acid ligase II
MRGALTSPKSLADPRSARTFPELIRSAALAYGDGIAIRTAKAGASTRALGFSELERRSAELSRALIACGAGKGSRIGFVHGNSPDLALTFAAITRIGSVAIPISSLLTSADLVRVIRQSDIGGLLMDRRRLGVDNVAQLLEALPALRDCSSGSLRITPLPYLRWIVSSGEALPRAVCRIEDFMAAAAGVSDELLQEMESEVHPTDQMIELYASDAEGPLRGMKHSHGAVLFRTHYLRSVLKPTRGEEIVAKLPMFLTGGLMMYLLPNLEAGATSVCVDQSLKSGRVATVDLVPTDGMKALVRGRNDCSLGMDESLGPYSHANALRSKDQSSFARLVHVADRFEVRVANDQGARVEDGELGEIQVRGYAVTTALHKMERADYFTADGYYRTGDLGYAEGTRLYVLGLEEMIQIAGTEVSLTAFGRD